MIHAFAALALTLLLLPGCAGVTTYVQQHAVGIALTGTVLGTVAAGESVIINTRTLLKTENQK